MKIEDNRQLSTKKFGLINIGDVFWYDDMYCMKTHEYSVSANIRKVAVAAVYTGNCVVLTGSNVGKIIGFCDSDVVQVVNAILTVGQQEEINEG